MNKRPTRQEPHGKPRVPKYTDRPEDIPSLGDRPEDAPEVEDTQNDTVVEHSRRKQTTVGE